MTHVFKELPVTPKEVLNCQFSSWAPLFPDNVHPYRIWRPLPTEFIQYLEGDSIRLAGPTPDLERTENDDYSDWEEDDEPESKLEELNDKEKPPSDIYSTKNDLDSELELDLEPNSFTPDLFWGLHLEIEETIAKYRSATPKLNWSMPKDARWILPNNTTQCTSANDVYLLLNASDHVNHDLDHAFDEVSDRDQAASAQSELQMELVLKKWVDINPALEFRVFVRGRKIVGISQRDANYFAFLAEAKPKITDSIVHFVNSVAVNLFPDPSFVLDVYVPQPYDKIWVIDVNPFSRTTGSLLFAWNELLETDIHNTSGNNSVETPPIMTTSKVLQQNNFQFRLVEARSTRNFNSREHSENAVPRDVVNATSDAQSMVELVREWKRLESTEKK